jgi:hypothetical protein
MRPVPHTNIHGPHPQHPRERRPRIGPVPNQRLARSRRSAANDGPVVSSKVAQHRTADMRPMTVRIGRRVGSAEGIKPDDSALECRMDVIGDAPVETSVAHADDLTFAAHRAGPTPPGWRKNVKVRRWLPRPQSIDG